CSSPAGFSSSAASSTTDATVDPTGAKRSASWIRRWRSWGPAEGRPILATWRTRVAKVLGIDLGTTNSVAPIMEAGEPIVLENSEGSRLTPSVVAVNPKAGERLIGQVARRQAITNPENTVFSIKRFMGRKFSDEVVQRALKHMP